MDYMKVRTWMYEPGWKRGSISLHFRNGVEAFLKAASCNKTKMIEIRCPCKKCHCMKLQDYETITFHLHNYGFMPNYYVWRYHGESGTKHDSTVVVEDATETIGANFDDYSMEDRMTEMVYDAAGPSLWTDEPEAEELDSEAKKFFDLLKASKRPLYKGCTMTHLLATSRLISIKSEFNASENMMNAILSLCKEMLPPDNVLACNWYSLKKEVSAFGLPYEKIDTCPGGCMIYWKEDQNLTNCKFCNKKRYKSTKTNGKGVPFTRMHYFPLTPRLQRLYASCTTAKHMRWHNERQREEGILCHPSDGEAWKHFDKVYPDFAKESRNVRLGLCTDGFAPFTSFEKPYSTWPVIVTPYNLPPWMCMKNSYMFLTVIVPGPKNPKNGIDVYLQPLVNELKNCGQMALLLMTCQGNFF